MRLLILTIIVIAASATFVDGQAKCISDQDSAKIIASMSASRTAPENKKLKKELLELVETRSELDAKISRDSNKNADLIPKSRELGRQGIARVCQLLIENGWPSKSELTDEGYRAMLLLISGSGDPAAQRALLPVLNEGVKLNLVERPFIATIVDGVRIGYGAPQLFGTRAHIIKDVVYIYPLLNDDKVDEWRAAYGLTSLAIQIRNWEASYLLPVVRAPRTSNPATREKTPLDGDSKLLGLDDSETALVVDSRIVNLSVRLLLPDTLQDAGLALTKDDFVVEENGVVQETSFFTDTERPFDVVLLLDFSGSTDGKQGLMKKAAQRFVDVVRPNDRVAVVAFANQISLMSDFSADKPAVKKKIDEIKENGMSPIWDSVRFVFETLLDKKTPGRRTAIVLMTDAFDSSRRTNFADAVELARRNETTIFPIFVVDKQYGGPYMSRLIDRSESMLGLLATETGGQVFKSKDLKDLQGIYERIAGAVGRVYSLAYQPTDDRRDGAWRELKVTIKGHPELVVLTRRGYYSN